MRASIIIPAYNAAGTLEAAIASAMAQTERDIEILVVDNGSKDQTSEIMDRLAAQDERIRTFKMPSNFGPSGARNLAFDNARGEWIAILDADDRFHPSRLATLLALGERTAADFVVDNLFVCREGGGGLDKPMLSHEVVAEPREVSFTEFMEHSLGKRGVPRGVSWVGLKPVWRRTFLSGTNIRYDEGCFWGEDYLIYIASFLNGATLWVTPEPLYYHTIRYGSLTDNPRLEDLQRVVEADLALLGHQQVVSNPRLRHAVKRHHDVHERWFQYLRFAIALKSRHAMRAAWLLVRGKTVIRTIAAHLVLDSLAYLRHIRGSPRNFPLV
jgi:glycosyltransferase involved in cell wall biosynthesis